MSAAGLSFLELACKLGVYSPASRALSHSYAVGVFNDNEPHGVPWHTSHHASDVPWDERWCPRKLAFGLMGVPHADESFSEEMRSLMEAGKDAEVRFVERYYDAGILYTAAPHAQLQTNFVDQEIWLSGSCDAGIVPPGWKKLHITDFKGCDSENKFNPRFAKLANGEAGPDPKHIAQVQTYLNLAERDEIFVGVLRLAGILPPDTGSVVYFNRARPSMRVEFFFDIDRARYERVRERLKQVNEAFLADELPEQPFDGKDWSVDPCRTCPLKKVELNGVVTGCKAMWKDDVKTLKEAGEHIEKADPTYDYEARREAVLARWNIAQ